MNRTKKSRRGTAILGLILCLPGSTVAQTYSSNVEKIFWDLSTKITPIGDIGDIETIVDVRGFVPLSMVSKDAKAGDWDAYRWFQFPLMDGIARLYYGNTEPATMKRLATAALLREEKATEEALEWTRFAYALGRDSGRDLFVSAGGTSDEFQSSEPVAVLFTSRSVILILNFRYSNFARRGSGQTLCGYEFSRALKEYKTFYNLHTTIVFSKEVKSAFDSSLPYVLKAASLYFKR